VINYIELGSSPANEPCVQTTDPNYSELGRAECLRYRDLLAASYSAAHGGKASPAALKLKSNMHDFGTYYEIAVRFDDRDPAQVRAAYWFEENAPTEWPAQ
jgi:hypothetical protein